MTPAATPETPTPTPEGQSTPNPEPTPTPKDPGAAGDGPATTPEGSGELVIIPVSAVPEDMINKRSPSVTFSRAANGRFRITTQDSPAEPVQTA